MKNRILFLTLILLTVACKMDPSLQGWYSVSGNSCELKQYKKLYLHILNNEKETYAVGLTTSASLKNGTTLVDWKKDDNYNTKHGAYAGVDSSIQVYASTNVVTKVSKMGLGGESVSESVSLKKTSENSLQLDRVVHRSAAYKYPKGSFGVPGDLGPDTQCTLSKL